MAGLCGGRNDIWCINNAVDAASVTGQSADPTLGPERIRDPRVGVAYRTPQGGATLTITFAVAVPVQVLSLHGLNPVTVPMELELSSTPGAGDIRTGPWAPDTDPFGKQAFWINERDMQLDPMPAVSEIVITFLGSADVGRIWAGPYHWTPCIGHSYGASQAKFDLSTRQRTIRGGAVFADAGKIQRGHSLQYDMIDEVEWSNQVFEMDMTVGLARQVLFIPNYDVYPPERHAILGYNEVINPIAALGFNKFQKAYVVREAG